jgi:hypothetical protein
MLDADACPSLSPLDAFTSPGTDVFVPPPGMAASALRSLVYLLLDECVVLREQCAGALNCYSSDLGVYRHLHSSLHAVQAKLSLRQYSPADLRSDSFEPGWIGRWVCLGCNSCGFTTDPAVSHSCVRRISTPATPEPGLDIPLPAITEVLGGPALGCPVTLCGLVQSLFLDRRALSRTHASYATASQALDDHNLIITLETANGCCALASNFFSIGVLNQEWTCWRGCDTLPSEWPFHLCPRRAGFPSSSVHLVDPSIPGASWSY